MPQHNDGKYIGPETRALARGLVAIVWLYQGLWCKLMARCPSHAAVVGSLPQPIGNLAGPLLMIIGTLEVALAIWVVSGWRSRLAAAAQTVLLLVMNGGGLVWGRSAIPDPFSTVLNNVVLLALVWIVSDAHV
ncbi:MAG TPA: DoxX-like family protein [Vicinamibacterales bacterium]|nr:DoxX-like family protein [Vicinamibacterales bacterium]